MSRLNDFKSTIKLSTAAEVRQEFGGILLFETDTDHEYKVYADLAAVLVDFVITTDTYKMAARIFNQELSPSGIAIIGEATATPAEITAKLDTVVNKNWYALVCTDNATATITALDTWVDTKTKVYVATTQVLTDIGTAKSKRTFIGFHDSADAYMMEGLLSYMLTHDIGSATAKFKKVTGIVEANITDPQLAVLRAAHGVTYIEEMGNLETTGSQTASGEHFDVVLGEDWINYNMEKEMHDLAVSVEKIGYSGNGIASLVGVATNVLNKATLQGIILIENKVPQFSIVYKSRAEMSQADRANREYDGITWEAYLDGAIEGGAISGDLIA
ncbi:DUF3383 family protein [Acetobacterium paludosum]|uniref:DUF3383 family protein n=1 Tax=Acetobacterium paludosum TaxID=52693 RepID=A0A923HVX2_9FIRM|nr:DUF3383 family protein [Acetobacterium paludosum]MBC3889514.1 DUF3383 family protein [Acetobacterium paludosum]